LSIKHHTLKQSIQISWTPFCRYVIICIIFQRS
jgi:hypothetical protein